MQDPTPSGSPVSPALARFHTRTERLRRRLRIAETTWLLLLAIFAGLAAGVGSIAFHALTLFVQWAATGERPGSGGPLATLQSSGFPAWRLVLAPALGGLVVGPLIHLLAREAKGHGIPAVVRAVHERGGRIGPVVAFVKTVASALTIGSGGSLGREGPVIQIGASLGSATGQLLGVTTRQLKLLAAAGAAGGLAAMFNAPLGGAFFALEVIVGSFAMDAFGPVVLASAAATLLSRSVLGDKPTIHVEPYMLEHGYELLVCIALGVVAGGLAAGFTRSIGLSVAGAEKLTFLPEWLKPSLGGLAVGLLALTATPRILGSGYETIDALAVGNPVEVAFFLLLAAKLAATCLTLASGGSGGVFGPSLFLGAVLGALVWRAAGILHLPTSPEGAYVIVGMAAVVAGTMHAPVSMTLMLFENTNDYKMVLPLLIATSVSSLLARKLYAESIDTVLDARAGRRVRKNLEEMALATVLVDEVAVSQDGMVVSPETPFPALVDRFLRARTSALAVASKDGRYLGAILLEDLLESLSELRLVETAVIAHDLLRTDVPTLAPDSPLTKAIEAFREVEGDALPVVGEGGKLAGFLREHDIVSALRMQAFETDLQSAFFLGEGARSRGAPVELPRGIALSRVKVPEWLAGRTLADADLRARHGVLVLAVRTKGEDGKVRKRLPDPKAPLILGEDLVLLAPEPAIEAWRQGRVPPEASPETAQAVAEAGREFRSS